jgi:hypothetical protein
MLIVNPGYIGYNTLVFYKISRPEQCFLAQIDVRMSLLWGRRSISL